MVRHCPDCETEFPAADPACPSCGRSLDEDAASGTSGAAAPETDGDVASETEGDTTAESDAGETEPKAQQPGPAGGDATPPQNRPATEHGEPGDRAASPTDEATGSERSRRNLLVGGAIGGLGLLWYLQRDDDGNALDGGGTVESSITTTSPRDPVNDYLAQPHRFEASADERVDIAVESTDFDTLLVLTGPSGDLVSQDDDSGDGLNSRLRGPLPASGEYTVWVTSYSGSATGQYALTVEFL